jgi:methionyl-tRNA formyltransferase
MNNRIRISFFGATKFSEYLLNKLLELNNIEVVSVFYIPEMFSISYSSAPVKNSNYADLKSISQFHNISSYEVDSVSGKRIQDYESIIKNQNLDVILVLGWYYMVPKSIRNLSKLGAWGIHASMLPNYAGGAPLVWAIINGEKETGVTLFKLNDGVDDGDIISQKSISIEDNDTILEVYEKAKYISAIILEEVLTNIDKIKFLPQDKSKIQVFPQRKPEDGVIDWSKNTKQIKDFIRAQSKPYPGAYTIIGDKKVVIWDATIIDLDNLED